MVAPIAYRVNWKANPKWDIERVIEATHAPLSAHSSYRDEHHGNGTDVSTVMHSEADQTSHRAAHSVLCSYLRIVSPRSKSGPTVERLCTTEYCCQHGTILASDRPKWHSPWHSIESAFTPHPSECISECKLKSMFSGELFLTEHVSTVGRSNCANRCTGAKAKCKMWTW